MFKEFFLMSLRNLRRRGIRSILTLLGIFIGIAAVVGLISMGQGLQDAITGQFSSLGTDKLIIQNSGTGFGPPGSTSVTKLTEHDLKIIESVNGVEEAIPRYLRVLIFEYDQKTSYSYGTTVPDNQKQIDLITETFNFGFESGRFIKAGERGKVVLGHDFTSEKYGENIVAGKRIRLNGESFEIVGIMNPASSFELNSVIILNEEDFKRIVKIGDEIDFVVVQVSSSSDIEKVAEDIKIKLRKDRNEKEGEEDFSVQTPTSSIQSINTILNIVNLIIAGIAAISLLVGAIGIANTMYTSVLERTREIGVMKSIGAKNSDVLLIFLIESGLLGLVGGIIGVAIGLGMSFGASAIANSAFGSEILKVSFSLPLVLGAIGFSFFMGIISGVLPALQASKMEPVEALRR
jgi:putative ABC transport system permease protein